MVCVLLKRLITAPPAGAGTLSVTVPVDVAPPLTLTGLSVSALRVGSEGESGVRVGLGVANEARVGVGDGSDVTVGLGDVDEPPTHNVALTFELL